MLRYTRAGLALAVTAACAVIPAGPAQASMFEPPRCTANVFGTSNPDVYTAPAWGAYYNGLAEADTITGSAVADCFWGEMGVDTIAGGDGADYIDGGDGDDIVRGGAGNDLLLDSGGHTAIGGDVVYGDAEGAVTGGADRIDPGPGEDDVYGGPGGDTIDVRDRETDVVDCGSGTDVLHADLDGGDVYVNCETVVLG